MKAVLSRKYDPIQTYGRFILLSGNKVLFQLLTLELPWNGNQRKVSCIPEGKYEVHKIWSPKFGKCYQVIDVPERDAILFHSGNYADLSGKSDTEGCILVGMNYGDIDENGVTDIIQSRLAMQKLMNMAEDKFELYVI